MNVIPFMKIGLGGAIKGGFLKVMPKDLPVFGKRHNQYISRLSDTSMIFSIWNLCFIQPG